MFLFGLFFIKFFVDVCRKQTWNDKTCKQVLFNGALGKISPFIYLIFFVSWNWPTMTVWQSGVSIKWLMEVPSKHKQVLEISFPNRFSQLLNTFVGYGLNHWGFIFLSTFYVNLQVIYTSKKKSSVEYCLFFYVSLTAIVFGKFVTFR